MLSRQRKRRRDSVFRYAHDYLGVKRLPRGVPLILREWEETWTEDDIQFGPELWELRAILDPHRRPYRGL